MIRPLLLALTALGALAPAAAAVVPSEGATVPRGTLIHAPACTRSDTPIPADPQNGDTYGWKAEFSTLIGPSGWMGDILAPECTPIAANALGSYTLRSYAASKLERLSLGTWFTAEDTLDEQGTVRFTVDDTKICLRFTSVTDHRGKPLSAAQLREIGLPDKQLRDGGIVSIPKGSSLRGVELRTPNGDLLRVSPRSSFALLSGCQGAPDPESTSTRVRIQLLLGTLWSKVTTRESDREFEVETNRVVCGVRGTEFGVTYDPRRKRTTVQVKSGRVDVRRLRAKKGIILTAGQRAVQQGSGPVRRVRG